MGYLLILGANSDMGKALAEKYASNRYDLYLADKDNEGLELVQQSITEQYGVDVQLLKFDVTEFYNHRNFYNSLSSKPFGVICAVDFRGEQERAQKDFLEAKRIIDVNYTGLVSMINIIANDFEDREAGFIVGVGYSGDKKEERANYIYKSAKAAFISYIEGLRERLSASGVVVNTILQGLYVEDVEKQADVIFNAQQKGKDVVGSKEAGNLAALVKGIGWK